MKEFGASYVERRLEVACLLAEVYMQMRMYDAAKHLLREESVHSRMFPMIHARILFLYAVYPFLLSSGKRFLYHLLFNILLRFL